MENPWCDASKTIECAEDYPLPANDTAEMVISQAHNKSEHQSIGVRSRIEQMSSNIRA